MSILRLPDKLSLASIACHWVNVYRVRRLTADGFVYYQCGELLDSNEAESREEAEKLRKYALKSYKSYNQGDIWLSTEAVEIRVLIENHPGKNFPEGFNP